MLDITWLSRVVKMGLKLSAWRKRAFINVLTDLESVVCPRPELHDAGLLVEGEVLDVDDAR